MTFPIRLLPAARAEFDAAADWYEQQRPGLGLDFVAHVRTVFERVSANPRIHAAIHGEVRKAVVKKYPYVVIYREEPDEVLIISVFHTSRDPGVWQARLEEE